MTPLCGFCLILGTPQISAASQNRGTDSNVLCVLGIVLFITHYTTKRATVQDGRRNSDGGTPPGAVTPTTPVGSDEHSVTPQASDEKLEISASDLEKGLNGIEDETVDMKEEKDDISEGNVDIPSL